MTSDENILLPPGLHELMYVSVGDLAKHFGIARSTAYARRERLLAPYYEEAARRHKEEQRLQRSAWRAVGRALQRGQLTRPERCSHCGALSPGPTRRVDVSRPFRLTGKEWDDGTARLMTYGWSLQAHHHRGYAPERALDVVWLCPSCHGRADNPGRSSA